MRKLFLFSAVILSLTPSWVWGQVREGPQPPGTLWPCNNGLEVFPQTFVIIYELSGTRAGGGLGEFRLYYTPDHQLLDVAGTNFTIGTYTAQDVQVEELFSDMGVWVMRQNSTRNQWRAECYRHLMQAYYLHPIAILGNLQQVEPPEEDCDALLVDSPNYDPTIPSGGSGTRFASTTCGGSGTPYSPGDNTGGELVDWGTGEGIGGSSVCGLDAVVEWVCIDMYVNGTWVEWSCGYATTC